VRRMAVSHHKTTRPASFSSADNKAVDSTPSEADKGEVLKDLAAREQGDRVLVDRDKEVAAAAEVAGEEAAREEIEHGRNTYQTIELAFIFRVQSVALILTQIDIRCGAQRKRNRVLRFEEPRPSGSGRLAIVCQPDRSPKVAARYSTALDACRRATVDGACHRMRQFD
jgi:hypothetical protein